MDCRSDGIVLKGRKLLAPKIKLQLMEGIHFWIFEFFDLFGYATDVWDYLQVWLANVIEYHAVN